MLSVVLIGRNDNHGYNLTKRVTQSINSISECLKSTDEIVFVDWNSPPGHPPMPIAIHDDLTEFAKKLLRIVVVPSSIHDCFSGQTNKKLLEPIARNVGMRRVNENSKWILNTNTDILVLNSTRLFLSDIAKKYNDNPTVAFRYEIPEFIWESFDRRDPKQIKNYLQEWHKRRFMEKDLGISLELKQRLFLPDAVGDFQLATKSLWYTATGFAEDMLKGWHVDTRAAIQLNNLSSGLKFIDSEELSIYHQNHLRTSTLYHSSSEANDESIVFENYQNEMNWGLADKDLPTFHLADYKKRVHIGIHLGFELLQEKGKRPTGNIIEIHKSLDYSLKHSAIFIMDEIQLLQEHDQVLIVSRNESLINWISSVCLKLNLPLVVCSKYNYEVNNFKLMILDLGIESEILVPSANRLVNDENITKRREVGQIVLNLYFWARKARFNDSRVLVIRAQNWATRTLVRNLFNVPLFNNYSSILAGQVKYMDEGLNFKTLVLKLGIKYNYGLHDGVFSNFTFRLIDKVFLNLEPKMQIKIKEKIKRLLRY